MAINLFEGVTGAGKGYFDDNPQQGWQLFVNKLGGQNSSLGRFAARRFNETYANYMKDAMGNPDLLFSDWLNSYSNSGNVERDYQGSSALMRDPAMGAPQWAGTRFLG